MTDSDDLKAATAHVAAAINSRNLEAFAANLHDEATFIWTFAKEGGKGPRVTTLPTTLS
jgi:hypothetical protein